MTKCAILQHAASPPQYASKDVELQSEQDWSLNFNNILCSFGHHKEPSSNNIHIYSLKILNKHDSLL